MDKIALGNNKIMTIREIDRLPENFKGINARYDYGERCYRVINDTQLYPLGVAISDINLEENTLFSLDNYNLKRIKELRLEAPLNTLKDVKQNLDLDLSCKYSCLINNRGQIVYGSHEHDYAYPASTTKIITALTALDYVKEEEEIMVGEEIKLTFEGDDPSLADVYAGEIWSFKDLLYGMLLPSGNDAAYEVGFITEKVLGYNGTAKEKMADFVARMNKKAQEIGMKSTHYMVPDGNSYYDQHGNWRDEMAYQVVSAYDECLAGLALLHSPLLSDVVSTSKANIKLKSGVYKSFENTNRFLLPNLKEFDHEVMGIKTGTTNPAGPCLVVGKTHLGRTAVAACLFNKNSGARYTNTKILLDRYFGEDNENM